MFRRSTRRAVAWAPALLGLGVAMSLPGSGVGASGHASCDVRDLRGSGDYKIKVRALSRHSDDKGTNRKDFTNFLVVSGTANKDLSKRICTHLGTTSTPTEVSMFSDGELSCNIKESVRGKDVYLIQSFGDPVQDNIMEVRLLSLGAGVRAHASHACVSICASLLRTCWDVRL